jgi:hypothetical protein
MCDDVRVATCLGQYKYTTNCKVRKKGKCYFTNVCLTLLRCDIISSEKPRCALTSSGGVKANHWLREMSWKRSKIAKSINEHQCDAVAKDVKRTCLENLEKFQRRVSNVLDIMAYQNKNGSNEIEIERNEVGCVPNDGGM